MVLGHSFEAARVAERNPNLGLGKHGFREDAG